LKAGYAVLKEGCAMGFWVLLIIATILGFAGFVLLLVNKWIKNDHETEKLRLQNEAAKLEIEQTDKKIKLLEEENKKYDKMLTEGRYQGGA
jgi:cell shape-determining protein MreC